MKPENKIAVPEISKTAMRAYQAWPLLVFAATNGQWLTYKKMRELTGLAMSSSAAVTPIFQYCKEKEYPRLTAIVVTGDGTLDKSVTPHATLENVEEVFNFDWIKNAEIPTLETLEDCWKRFKEENPGY